MEITEVFFPKNRAEWRAWLEANRADKTEIWLQRFNKASGKPSVTYDELVEECLCFGWIDGVIKKLDEESRVQRITPRRKKGTVLSELNRQRVWRLQNLEQMTPSGIAPIADQIGSPEDPFEFPDWIRDQLQADPQVWENFEKFPHFYQRLKIGWIVSVQNVSRRSDEARRRLNYLIKMTAQGKRYGTEPLSGIDI